MSALVWVGLVAAYWFMGVMTSRMLHRYWRWHHHGERVYSEHTLTNDQLNGLVFSFVFWPVTLTLTALWQSVRLAVVMSESRGAPRFVKSYEREHKQKRQIREQKEKIAQLEHDVLHGDVEA